MAERSCSSCRFAKVAVGEDDAPRLDCRRFPPAVITTDEVLVAWPQVSDDDWCGEWQAEL